MRQESALLEARSAPLRKYLIENVIPTLTQGLLEVAKAKPKDPVDFLVCIVVSPWCLPVRARACVCVCSCCAVCVMLSDRCFVAFMQAEYLFKQSLTEGE